MFTTCSHLCPSTFITSHAHLYPPVHSPTLEANTTTCVHHRVQQSKITGMCLMCISMRFTHDALIWGSVVGIDSGMMNLCISVMEGQQAQVIENSEGPHTAPSVVAFTKHNECLASFPAKHQAVINPSKLFFLSQFGAFWYVLFCL